MEKFERSRRGLITQLWCYSVERYAPFAEIFNDLKVG